MPPQANSSIGLGTPEFAEKLLCDLYITLRRNLLKWSEKTKQTPQARMGYIGQHLVSVVTGFEGGRSGARGDDLKLPGDKTAEIKCCNRVDQLGTCKDCGAAVASNESNCHNCNSTNFLRKKDSKWLISPKSTNELLELFIPERYYLVLFEFVDVNLAGNINVKIFAIDPRTLGFALCMIDYFFNIRENSKSHAPFDFWPDSPKFWLMKPKMIYWSVINTNDTITPKVFPGQNPPQLFAIPNLGNCSRKNTITETAIDALAQLKEVTFTDNMFPVKSRKQKKLELLQQRRETERWDDEILADDLARIIYKEKVHNLKIWTDMFAPTL